MADTKISALPASTTPLAGTEVLPIVQSSTTKQVSVANLTSGRSFDALGMTLTSTDAGAAAAPLLELYRDSASPAASDTLGEIEFNGEDSAGNKQAYGLIHGSILSPTSTAEQGQLHFETATAGALTEKMIIGTTNLVINEIGAVFNVRIEGDTDANLFFTDATNSRVGIGTISPAVKLDVAGTIAGTQLNVDNLRLDANIISSQDTNGTIDLLPNGTGIVQATTKLSFRSNAQDATGSLAEYRVSLSTIATDISVYDGTWGHLAIVTGLGGGGGDFFTDLVFSSATAGPTVLSAKIVSGAPAARTYSMSGSNKLQLAMASGTYDVRSAILYGLG
jgi:hypothetical protein